MYKKHVLSNGLRIISNHMPDKQSVALGIWINVGGRYEMQKNKGMSHFLEHLLFKGSKKYSCRAIKESIEGIGGSLNGFTSEEMTCYLVKIPAKYQNLAFEVLSDMVLNPVLPKLEIEKEKTVILEEIKLYRDLPQSYVHELLDELLWPDQPLGKPVIGTAESVGAVDKEELSLFKNNFYTPVNMVVSAVGCLDQARLVKLATKAFSSKEESDKNVFTSAIEAQSKPQLKVFHKETEQTHLALGFHSFKRGHALRHAQGLLHVILGANMSSRLFNEVREKRGLAYEIGTQVKRFMDTGAFIVHAGIDNRKVDEALKLILKELSKIRRNPVTKDEFNRAKEFYLGQLLLGLEDTLEHMLWIGETTVTLDKVYSLEEIIKEVKEVKIEDLQEVANCIFERNKLNLALIGPLKDKEQHIYKQLEL
ncbi:MAG: pitrilysin family protein [Candidatus Omnitrophica bacterium]|nr:pitrilysin family protein [Candidatus Omnitrophota bacterium]